jgi:integrase
MPNLQEALDLVLADHRVNERRDLPHTVSRTVHLRRLLDLTAAAPTIGTLLQYAQARQGEGSSPATLNRELAVLRRGCSLAGIEWPRQWRQLREAPPRTGFTDRAELERACAHLAPAYADAARFCFLTGWRRGEALSLRWSEVDFEAGEVRLLAGTTKNREPRVFPLYPQLRALLWDRRPDGSLTQAWWGNLVFTTDGRPLRSFSYHWRRACVQAGCPALLVHDFRRTAARNLIEAGVDRQVAMRLLGHKTESVFNRYRITTGKELTIAADKLSKLLA